MQPACTDISWSRRGAFLLKSEVFADACVRIGDSSFRCHKIVLASASEFFQNLFANEGLETGEVALTETDPRIFQTFLDYIYTWNEEPLLKLKYYELLSLLESSHMWMAVEVEKTCVKIIEERCFELNPNTLIKLYGVAYLLEKKSIMDKVIGRMKSFEIDHPEIYNLGIECFTEYLKQINWIDAGKRFEMAEKWITKNVSPNEGTFFPINWNSETTNSNPVLLSEKVAHIFQYINFENMPLDQFYNGPGKSKLLADSKKVEIIYKIACKNNRYGYR